MAKQYDMYDEDWTPGEILAEDQSGTNLREMLDVLKGVQSKFKSALDRGVTPDEFAKGSALLAGFDAAAKGLTLAWEKRRKAK